MRFSYGLLAACALGLMGAAANAPTMQVRDAWARWLPGNLPAGGYVTLINSSDRPISLITASSPDYALVSMHRTLTAAGISQMLPVDKITVEAHSAVEFGAQGYHLMLERPTRSLRPGDRVAVTLQFAGSPAVTATLVLRQPGAGGETQEMPATPQMTH
jgi:periplasmic copper chaperone A